MMCRSLYLSKRIPFALMWSPSLVPKPKDWPSYVDVVGAFIEQPVTGKHLLEVAVDREKRQSQPSRGLENLRELGATRSEPLPPREDAADSMATVSLENSRLNAFFAPNHSPASMLFPQGGRASTMEQANPTAKQPQRPPPGDVEYDAPPELARFLASGPPPIFVGFGSMVIKDPATLIKLLLEAAAMARVRVLVQSGWSQIDKRVFAEIVAHAQTQSVLVKKADDSSSDFFTDFLGIGSPRTSHVSTNQHTLLDREWDAALDLFLIGPCPHPWLFKRVCAVVHHGGAGTTAAGLIAAKPTWICPFFGDQHFWGEMVNRYHCGPKPCPVSDLTVVRAAESFAFLLSDECVRQAAIMSKVGPGRYVHIVF
jgi:UDP:flavonoid glycosyltransferase YjiC (YdhE family)